jgi:hypothetical protein
MFQSESSSFNDEVQNCDTGFGRIKQLKLRKIHPGKPEPKVYWEKYQGKKKKSQELTM